MGYLVVVVAAIVVLVVAAIVIAIRTRNARAAARLLTCANRLKDLLAKVEEDAGKGADISGDLAELDAILKDPDCADVQGLIDDPANVPAPVREALRGALDALRKRSQDATPDVKKLIDGVIERIGRLCPEIPCGGAPVVLVADASHKEEYKKYGSAPTASEIAGYEADATTKAVAAAKKKLDGEQALYRCHGACGAETKRPGAPCKMVVADKQQAGRPPYTAKTDGQLSYGRTVIADVRVDRTLTCSCD